MRIAFIILIILHGIIHLFGFLKAFKIAEFSEIHQSVSKASGILWLLTFLLFSTTTVLMLIQSEYWWASGFLALITSQFLIFSYWSDAKFGTILNVIVLLAAVLGYANFNFKNIIKSERETLFEHSKIINHKIVQTNEISSLPPIIQKWLTVSGVIGKPKVSNVYLIQELKLKLKPEQTEWNTGTAEQYFTIHPPAFNWNINTQMNPILNIVGRDKFENGQGEMLIKLLSLIPVVDAKNDQKVDQATLQRYLAEIVWFPSASLSPYIKWETINDFSAKATLAYMGTIGSGIFFFDENGKFKEFIAMRYKDAHDTEPTEWIVTATETEERNGIQIPVACEASWQLNNEKWTWLKLKIEHIEYNVEKMPMVN